MTLRPAGKTLSSLTGIVVMAAVLWLLLNFVYAPSCGRFACSYVPSWLPQASADSGDACPDSITAAASDAAWAADRSESIKDAKLTTGLYYDPDGTQHRITSGHEGISDRVEEILRSSGMVSFPPVGRHPAITHVETKIAMTMREAEVTTVVAVINNEEGPCPGPYSCQAVLGVVLPAGYTLTVWWPGRATPETFTGQE
ncbi:DddA-like double-stranded DNA deaminase toxin [Actinophytocola oryzae]|uniref:Nucleic acid/nucleotide deaminase of polymorphic system toxin n=1 Tax=Actinophytocola oryzae TaxID=502181 RepID=A0A4R7VVU5_9PSEU|nr:DddA-like double-stranded DNA deaminase toxin [Actinophytocola oryzae]TDV53758.1 nucleic acid/nucleotide deaminase of polymorphic system toxin [Actinophytocola oryzae]